MRPKEKIFNSYPLLVNLLLILLVFIFSTIFNDEGKKIIAFAILPALFVAPLVVVVNNKFIYRYLFGTGLLLVVLMGILGANLRLLKNILPYPKIDELQAIGYEHYYNYPLNFDAIVIYLLFVFPFMASFIIWVFFNKRRKEK